MEIHHSNMSWLDAPPNPNHVPPIDLCGHPPKLNRKRRCSIDPLIDGNGSSTILSLNMETRKATRPILGPLQEARSFLNLNEKEADKLVLELRFREVAQVECREELCHRIRRVAMKNTASPAALPQTRPSKHRPQDDHVPRLRRPRI